MPATLVSNTTRFIVYEVPNGDTTLRVEITGRNLIIDPVTGQITAGTVSKISSYEYEGDTALGAGRTWANLDTTVTALNTLLGTAWQEPQPGTLQFYTAMGALPAETLVTTFTSTGTFVQGTDLLEMLTGAMNNDTVMGAGGNDRLFGREGNDEVFGGSGDDRVYGEAGDDLLHGDSGNDRLYGGSGYNSLYGGEGNDALSTGDEGAWMDGGLGNDNLIGGAGDDDQRGGDGNDNSVGGLGNDTQFGDAGDDKLTGGEGNDALYGGEGIDKLIGGLGNDQLDGGDGDDRLDGKEGDDVLFGGAGNDTLNGGDGNDAIYMETGNDAANGGLGLDQFIFDETSVGAKTIAGFMADEDQVIFAQFQGDADSGYQYFLSHAASVGRNVVFTDGELSITFNQTLMSSFELDNFGVDNGGGGGGGGGLLPS